MSTRPLIGVQLYTLRDKIEDANFGMAKTLREVAASGYEGVEFGGSYGEMDAASLKPLLDELNLKTFSLHTGIDALQNTFDRVVEDALLLDARFLAVAYSGEEYRSREGAITLGKTLNELGAKLNSSGIQLLYHNHDFEFARFDDEYMLDIVYANSDEKLVKLEVDTFWVNRAGVDPASYIRQYSGRVPLVHLKDASESGDVIFAPVGAGTMKWDEVFAAAEAGGTVAYIVEQDQTVGDSLEAVRISIGNLKKMGKLG